MSNRTKSTASKPKPWWLGGEDEECGHCGHGYARAAEVHCAECDDACCVLCATCIEGRMLCPECDAEAEG
jgi:hypothetical protein